MIGIAKSSIATLNDSTPTRNTQGSNTQGTARRFAVAAVGVAAAALPMVLPAPAHAAPASTSTSSSAPALHNFEPASARVTASTLTVRGHATTASSKVATLKQGEWFQPVCSMVGQRVAGSSTWYWAEANRTAGWVSAQYTRLAQGSVPACSNFRGMLLMHADVATPAQAATKLAHTSPSFAAYIARESASLGAPGCPSHNIIIEGWWSSNQAIGDVVGCGGYKAMWTLKNGTWHETGWNGDVPCSDLSAAGATHAVPGSTGVTCWVPSGRGKVLQQFVPGR